MNGHKVAEKLENHLTGLFGGWPRYGEFPAVIKMGHGSVGEFKNRPTFTVDIHRNYIDAPQVDGYRATALETLFIAYSYNQVIATLRYVDSMLVMQSIYADCSGYTASATTKKHQHLASSAFHAYHECYGSGKLAQFTLSPYELLLTVPKSRYAGKMSHSTLSAIWVARS